MDRAAVTGSCGSAASDKRDSVHATGRRRAEAETPECRWGKPTKGRRKPRKPASGKCGKAGRLVFTHCDRAHTNFGVPQGHRHRRDASERLGARRKSAKTAKMRSKLVPHTTARHARNARQHALPRCWAAPQGNIGETRATLTPRRIDLTLESVPLSIGRRSLAPFEGRRPPTPEGTRVAGTGEGGGVTYESRTHTTSTKKRLDPGSNPAHEFPKISQN